MHKQIVAILFFVIVFPIGVSAAASNDRPVESPALSIAIPSMITDGLEAIGDYVFGDNDADVEAPAPDLALALARRSGKPLTFKMTGEVERFVQYYSAGRGKRTTVEGLARSSEMRARAEEIFVEEGVPADLVWLAQVESGWKATAVSPVGAGGVWQFMPKTGERFGLTRDEDGVDERLDFEKATRAAAKYLRILNKRYDGNWELAIGAYNCGEGNMDKAIERAGGVRDFWTLCALDLLPEETMNYVPKVLAAGIICKNPNLYGLDPATTAVVIPAQAG